MVVEQKIITGEQAWQRLRRHFELLVNHHRRIVWAHHAMEHVSQIIYGIEKQALHRIPQSVTGATLRKPRGSGKLAASPTRR
jgi:hypothetical protein